MTEEGIENKAPIFYRTHRMYFDRWASTGKTVLKQREQISVTGYCNIKALINDKTSSVIAPVLGDHLLLVFQVYDLVRDEWEELQERYAGQKLINKLRTLQIVLNLRNTGKGTMGGPSTVL